jgi:hypothetical protein
MPSGEAKNELLKNLACARLCFLKGLWGALDSLSSSSAIAVSAWWNLIQTLDRSLEKPEQILECADGTVARRDVTYLPCQ